MKTRLLPPGANTSVPEIVHISPHGFWLNVDGREYFLPFTEFPWFKSATRDQIRSVELGPRGHLYWPLLDVDLSLDIIENPHEHPLVYS